MSKKILSLVLAVAVLFSTVCFGTKDVSAAGKNPWDYSSTPTRAIYYTSPVMKGNDVKWVQQALNLYGNYKLAIDGSFGPASKEATKKFQKAMKITQDGSFGPDTRSKMIKWLNSKGYYANSSSSTSGSKITTKQIQTVLDKYGYKTGKYWTYAKGGSATKSYVAGTRAGRQYSYSYNGVECYGFANFVMHKVTGTTVNPNNGNKNGWKYIKSSNVKELKVGDIVRIGKNNSVGHTGVVLTVDSKGNCTFAECWGGVNNKLNIGGKLSSSKYGSHSTLKSMKANGSLLYVYRYEK